MVRISSSACSWPQLSPSTEKRYAAEDAGHKLLIKTGMLRNSIGISQTTPDNVIINTNVKYAAIHQFGSRDRGSVGFGPRTEAMQGAMVNVRQHGFARRSRSLGKGQLGNRVMNIRGPRNQIRGIVSAHGRHQNIPARPYMVFRPKDPRRIQSLVNSYIRRAREASGLGGQ